VAVQEEIERFQIRLEGEMKDALERLNFRFKDLNQRLASLEKKLPELEKAEQELKRSTEDQGIVASGMQRWVNQLKFSKMNYEADLFAFDRDRIKLSYHGLTQLNENPVSPNRMGLFMYATILGLMLAVGVPFMIEYLDHTLSNMEDVEATFQLRGLGIIPKLATSDENSTLLDRATSKETNLLENFRVIRTNLLSMGSVTKPPHVVIVTSAMPKEGKTFVSTNLALSFAQTGAKTLIMDTDLRRGRLHRLFGYRKQPGLSGVLLNQVTLDEAIRPTQSENLFMLSAGQHLETGTELLGSQKFLDILEELKKRFERIVMDTPPVLGLSETSILQNHVDGVLFVIWSGQTPIKSVKAAIEILQANGANFYGFVLNRLDLSATANYYQYYYYSHDYYYQYTPRALENS
jgi:capsular exopolysaccharide synthesis family protein